MKRFFLFALAATVFAACSTDTTQDLAPEIPTAPDELQVSFDEEDTRIQLGDAYRPVWTKGDLVSVFYRSNANSKYQFTGETGDANGSIKLVEEGVATQQTTQIVAVYPYSEDYWFNWNTYDIEASLPAEQTYLKDSFGVGSSLMVSSNVFTQLSFKNVCGWLKLQFTGTGYISKIVLKGNNGEQVAGKIYVNTSDASSTLASTMGESGDDIIESRVGGFIEEEGAILTEITLNCGDGVALNSETPTAFYVALPPQTFEKGFTATIYGCDGSTKEISTENSITIERNHILPMASATLEMPIPSNEIWYTSSDGNVIEPYKTDVFGANITSNTYENGQGVITFDGGVTTIGKEAFKSCSSLTSVTIGNSVTTIGEDAFYNCSSLTSISIPKSVTSIKGETFSYCTKLKRVDITDLETWCRIDFDYYSASNPLSYAGNLYLNGELVEDLVIPESITEVGWAVFFGAKCLKSVTFHNRVTSIEGWAFNECTSLTSITIPESVTAIGFDIFGGCDALKAFYGKFASADNRCLIADGVLKAFAPAGLTEYTILDRVTEIGRQAFIGCRSLTSVTIPDSVTKIGNQAFNSCYALKEVYCMPTTPPSLGNYVFNGNASDRKIYVPAASLETYKAAEGWKEYADYIFPMPEESQNNKIFYTSSDGNVIEPYKTDVFGANIVSNTYENGQGVITFDGEVTTIGKEAFKSCKSLTSVTIPDSVTTIGEDAFRGCTALTNINIPNSVTKIGFTAFFFCTSLTRVDIIDLEAWCKIDFGSDASNPLSEVGGEIYLNGELLEKLVIPESITYVKWGVFQGAKCLKSVNIHNKVTSISMWAFEDCDALTSVTIPDSVTEIGKWAFRYCSALKEVYCKPTTPPSLGSDVFFGNASGRKIYVPAASLETYKAAEGWKEYADAIVAMPIPSNEIWYTSSDGNVVTPYSGYYNSNATAMQTFGANITSNTYENGVGVITFDGDVTKIGEDAFYNCTALTSVTIPDSVTTIGDSAFQDCSALTSVTIPDNVTTIGNFAFYDCSALTSVTIGNSVTTIGTSAFQNCFSLTSITIPDSVTTIGEDAFQNCSSLTSITILDSVTTIGYRAFQDCDALTSVTIPDSVTTIGSYAFASCDALKTFYGKFASEDNRCLIVDGVLNSFAPAGLTEYTIPDSVTKIGAYAFQDCDALTSVTIPDSVTTIRNYAFHNCDALTSVTIPDSVTTIGDSAFNNCRALKAFYGKFASADNRCLIENGVLNSFAPAGLTTYSIPDSVTTIGRDAFDSCDALTSVTIPDSVTTIGYRAFVSCFALKEVYCKPTTPPSLDGSSVFDNNASGRKIYVPTASVDAYKAKQNWSEYASAIEPYNFAE